MDGEVYELILRSAQEHGVLPLTSKCNVACLFCSNRQNPPDIRAFDIETLTLEQIDEILSYMTPKKKIVIGESATRINEGEPLTHPDFIEVLRKIRKRFPETLIQITTNGSLLTDSLAAQIRDLEPLEIFLSLNSASSAMRFALMNDMSAQQAVQAPAILKKHGVAFHGSLVAQPAVLGWEDMEKTISALADNGARTIRIFMPGYTRWYDGSCQEKVSRENLAAYARAMTRKYDLPVLSEPPDLKDLRAVVEGVVSPSPASVAGLQVGDIVEKIDGVSVWSRNHAFNLCQKADSPVVEYRRLEQEFTVRIRKKTEESSGLVFYDDMNLQRMMDLRHQLERYKNGRVLVLTSILALPVVTAACRSILTELHDLRIISVPNTFWGGTIVAAGLLTVKDFIAAIKDAKYDQHVAVLPQEPFDQRGHDLMGVSFREISETAGCEIILA